MVEAQKIVRPLLASARRPRQERVGAGRGEAGALVEIFDVDHEGPAATLYFSPTLAFTRWMRLFSWASLGAMPRAFW